MPGDVAPVSAGTPLHLSDDTPFLKLVEQTDDTTVHLTIRDLLIVPNGVTQHYAAGGYLFGRRSKLDGLLPFTSRVLSRNHIQLLIDTEGAVWAVDLKSLHGTAIERTWSSTAKCRTITLKANVPMRLEHDDLLIFGKPVCARDGIEHQPLRVRVQYYHQPAQVEFPAAPTFASSSSNIKMPGYVHRGYGIPVMYESEQEAGDGDDVDDDDGRDTDSVVCLDSRSHAHSKPPIEIIEVRDSPDTEPEPSRHSTPKEGAVAHNNADHAADDDGAQNNTNASAARCNIDFDLPAFPNDDVFDLPSPPANMALSSQHSNVDEPAAPEVVMSDNDDVSSEHDEISSQNSDMSIDNSDVSSHYSDSDSEHDSSGHSESDDDEGDSEDESERHSEASEDEGERFWRTEGLFAFSHPSVSEADAEDTKEDDDVPAVVKSSVPEENEESEGHDTGAYASTPSPEPKAYEGVDDEPMDAGSPQTMFYTGITECELKREPERMSRSPSPLYGSPVYSPDAPYIPHWAMNSASSSTRDVVDLPSEEENDDEALRLAFAKYDAAANAKRAEQTANMRRHIDHFFNTATFDHDDDSVGVSLPPSPPCSDGEPSVTRAEVKSMSTAPLTPPSPLRQLKSYVREDPIVPDSSVKDVAGAGAGAVPVAESTVAPVAEPTVAPVAEPTVAEPTVVADHTVVAQPTVAPVTPTTTTPSRKRKRDDEDDTPARPVQAPRTLSFLKGIAVGVGLGASLTFGALYQLGAE